MFSVNPVVKESAAQFIFMGNYARWFSVRPIEIIN